ncbi:MAG: FHA domain-containing protein [Myxococcota bacterium]
MPVPLSPLLIQHLKDPVAFAASVTSPALVWEGPPVHEADELFSSRPTGGGVTHGSVKSGETRVYFVKKDSVLANPFSMGVTIGRMNNNDIVVDDESVSRFHAFLQQDAKSGQWGLTDAGGDNGVFIDGRRLDVRAAQPLTDGTLVTFGRATLTFFTRDGLVRFVERRAAGDKR